MSRYLTVLCIMLLWTAAAIAGDNVSGHITGAWIPHNIGPISGGVIYAFDANAGRSPQRDRSRRVPDAMAVTDDKGKFTLELAEGSYYLSTRKRYAGNIPGPPQDGDLYGLSRDKTGKPITYTVKRGKTTDIGILRRATVYKSRTRTISADAAANSDMATIAGTLKAADGSPLAGAVVQLYANPEVTGRPIYVSHKTGKDGKYRVQIDEEGTYFVTARAGYGGGRPRAGDLYGVYGGDTAQPITVKKQGETAGIDIQVGKFIDRRPN
ncbi:MAG: carboxypeptidase-like regulatory domain-containing protein [Geobacteraceae bacterium]|nr:carboxypeptidase-like regulatory domain-containing protein [Geobacteraceae bacterium]